VWANYCLSCHNNKLLDDNDALQNFGVRNNSQVCPLHSVFKFILYIFSANLLSGLFSFSNIRILRITYP